MDPFINIIILLIILYFVWSVYRWVVGAATQPFRRYRRSKLPEHPKLANSVRQFVALTNHIDTAFNQNQRLSAAQKKSLRAEIKQVQEHLINLLWKMENLHVLRVSIKDAANQFDLMSMQRKLQMEIDRSMEVLEQTSVALVKLDVMSGKGSTERLLADLSETNQRLAATGESYEEMQRIGRLSR